MLKQSENDEYVYIVNTFFLINFIIIIIVFFPAFVCNTRIYL